MTNADTALMNRVIATRTMNARHLDILNSYGEVIDLTIAVKEVLTAMADDLLGKGWTEQDIVEFILLTEECCPWVEEEYALAQMKLIQDKYQSETIKR